MTSPKQIGAARDRFARIISRALRIGIVEGDVLSFLEKATGKDEQRFKALEAWIKEKEDAKSKS